MRSNAWSAWEPAGRGPLLPCRARASTLEIRRRPSEAHPGRRGGRFRQIQRILANDDGRVAGRTSATGVGRRLSRYHPDEHARAIRPTRRSRGWYRSWRARLWRSPLRGSARESSIVGYRLVPGPNCQRLLTSRSRAAIIVYHKRSYVDRFVGLIHSLLSGVVFHPYPSSARSNPAPIAAGDGDPFGDPFGDPSTSAPGDRKNGGIRPRFDGDGSPPGRNGRRNRRRPRPRRHRRAAVRVPHGRFSGRFFPGANRRRRVSPRAPGRVVSY